MKKLIMIICVFGLMFSVASSAIAGASKTEAAGAVVTIADTDGTIVAGGPLTFDPSPTSIMSWATIDNAYTLTSVSSNNLNNEAGMEYCVGSASSGVFKKQAGAAVTQAANAGSTLAGFK